ncbi:MAG: hypothetical protein Q9O74_06800 [Planctomycetota bacterium]|nr:hypothetical protein [Planctomycetota bacterium]
MGQAENFGSGSVGRTITKTVFCALVLALGVTTLGGCGPSSAKVGRYTVSVSPTGVAADQAYDVDIFGVASEGEFAGWGPSEVAGHFAGGSMQAARDGRKPVTLHWEVGDSSTKQLLVSDPMWDTWIDRGAWYLVIASNREFVTGQGARQPARPIVLPLDKRRWKTNVLTIAVEGSGLQLTTRKEPLPE